LIDWWIVRILIGQLYSPKTNQQLKNEDTNNTSFVETNNVPVMQKNIGCPGMPYRTHKMPVE